MVDTIKFLISEDLEVFNAIWSAVPPDSLNIISDGFMQIKGRYASGNIPSYDPHINFLFDTQEKKVYLEFSIPKSLFKNNIRMIKEQEIDLALNRVFERLQRFTGGVLPLLAEWRLQSLDICYNWYTHSEDLAKDYLELFRGVPSGRKKRTNNETSFNDAGSWFVTKFYLKHEEFRKHDFKQLLKLDEKLAYRFLTRSMGVLRFEVRLRKQQLIEEFGSDLRWSSLSLTKKDIILIILRKYFNKFLGNFLPIAMNETQIEELLSKKYSKRVVSDLMIFIVSGKERRRYSKYRKSRYRKLIREAGVGLNSLKSLPTLEIV